MTTLLGGIQHHIMEWRSLQAQMPTFARCLRLCDVAFVCEFAAYVCTTLPLFAPWLRAFAGREREKRIEAKVIISTVSSGLT
jgi:hypothetical protein